jgi:aspartyl protease family protein
MRFHPLRRSLLGGYLGAMLIAQPAWAQSVALQGIVGKQVMVSINGAPTRFLREGQQADGVTVDSVIGQTANFRIHDFRFQLKVGTARANDQGQVPRTQASQVNTSTQSPETLIALARHNQAKTRLTIKADAVGHYETQGSINGKPVNFLVDTGATHVAMNVRTAKELELDFQRGIKTTSQTAAGVLPSFRIVLDEVKVGDFVLKNVQASILDDSVMNKQNGDSSPPILLGMSFLSRLKLTSENNAMVMELP